MKKKNDYNIPNEFSVPEEFSKPREEGQYRRAEFGTELKSEPGIDQNLEYSEEHKKSQDSGFLRGKGSKEENDSAGGAYRQNDGSSRDSQSSDGSGTFGRRYRRMTKFAVSAAIIFLVYPMMDIDLFEPITSAAPIITPVVTPSEAEVNPPETDEPGESVPIATEKPGESGSETEEPEASSEESSKEAAQGEEQTLIVSGTPAFEPINSEGSIRRQTDTEYEFVFKADKEIDTGGIDFNGEPDAYERAVEYLASQGVDVSGFYLADTEFVKIGEEESDDLIFVGDRDDLANAYVMQGTLTIHYRKMEIYKNY